MRKKSIRASGFYLLLLIVVTGLTGCSGGGVPSGPGGVTVPDAPAGVSLSSAAVVSGGVLTGWDDTISWTSAIGVDSYNIYWSNTSGVNTSNGTKIAGVTNPYTNSVSGANTRAFYVVTAINTAGESVESNEVGT